MTETQNTIIVIINISSLYLFFVALNFSWPTSVNRIALFNEGCKFLIKRHFQPFVDAKRFPTFDDESFA